MSAPEINESQRSIANWLNWLFERDGIIHAPVSIDVLHHEIHEGGLFTGGTVVSVNGTLAFSFTAGPSLYPHFIHRVECEGAGSLTLYENPTIGTVGNVLDVWNHKRSSSGTSTMVMYAEPAVSNVGTWRTTKIFGGTGVGGATQAGQNERGNEIIFDNDQEWLAVVETGGALLLNYEATWYEESE